VAQLGFARVSAHPLLGYGMTPDDAFGVLRRLLADSRHQFVPDDLSCADRVVRTDLMAGPNQITDRYLVALARQHGLALATLDEPLAKQFAGEAKLIELVN
jgi:predicted nucleic acid-binding protein